MTNRHRNMVSRFTTESNRLNKFSIDAAGIGEALQRSAASLSDANTSLEKSVALIATSNSVLMNPEKVGTALRTISLRLRGAKLELEQMGLDSENMVESTAKLRKEILAVAGIDILKEDGKASMTYMK